MARLPKKPANIVHEFFPVGTDGHSPMNNIDGAFEAMQYVKGKHPKYNKEDEEEKTLLNYIGPKEVKEGPSASEVEEKETEKAEKKKKQQDAWKDTMAFKKEKVGTVKLDNVNVTAKKKRGSGDQLPNQYTDKDGNQIFLKPGQSVPKGAKKASR